MILYCTWPKVMKLEEMKHLIFSFFNKKKIEESIMDILIQDNHKMEKKKPVHS